MKILAIDTSSAACSVALLLDDNIKALHEVRPLQQAQYILGMIEELLKSNRIELKQLDALAFGCGPGSFTGVRIATSVIQGLGFALSLPVIPISSLAALAQAAHRDLGWQKMLVGVDARIQEVYWAAYEVNQQGLVHLIGNEIVCAPAEVVIPNNSEWCGVGNAWEIYRQKIPFNPPRIDVTRLPQAMAVAQLAQCKFICQEWVAAREALPTYLRNNVAKKEKNRKLSDIQ